MNSQSTKGLDWHPKALVASALQDLPTEPRLSGIGRIRTLGNGIAQVSGLDRIPAEDLIALPRGQLGIAFNLEADSIGVILLGKDPALAAGEPVRALGRTTDTPVGEALLGRVIDATGRPLDGRAIPQCHERRPIERPAPGILARAPVAIPLQTGIKAIDALVPIGRGQRELILGDRQTGKTTLAVDAILNQADSGVISLYCAIGQRGTAVARVIDDLRRHDALAHSIVLVASGEDLPGLQVITPFAAVTIGEYFMEQGRDVLLVIDDLSRHARAYRELSLLLRRPPGREGYPGDIFYLHARLLERATRLSTEAGGGSLTLLPIAETQAEDISAYIPTNLISITDGQIYLSPRLFRKGLLPALDVGRSVSRVGGKTQLPAYRQVAGDLRLAYAQFEELETFSRFATRLDEDSRRRIARGRRVREVLKQPPHHTLSVPAQILVLHAVNQGLFDALPLEEIPAADAHLRDQAPARLSDLCQRIDRGAPLDEQSWARITEVSQALLTP